MKARKVILATLGILLLLAVVVLSLNGVFKYSYYSVHVACNPGYELVNMQVAGSFEVNETSPKGQIILNIPDSPGYEQLRIETYKHENCHLKQFQQRRLFNCALGGSLKFINEVECYVAEDLPGKYYEAIY